MFIAIDINEMHDKATGVGRYLSDQTTALLDVATEAGADADFLLFKGLRPNTFDFSKYSRVRVTDKWKNVRNTFLRSSVFIPHTLSQKRKQLFYSANHAPFRKPHSQTKFIVTVYDIIAITHPQYFAVREQLLGAWSTKRIINTSDHIFVISNYVKDLILERFKIDPARISLCYPGLSDIFRRAPAEKIQEVRTRYKIERPYILSVSTLDKRKNITGVIKAFLNSRLKDHFSLVLTGGKGWQHEKIYKMAGDDAAQNSVIFTGYVSNPDLVALYSGAECFIYPSLEEGFGLPIIESMACGTPVITSNCSSMPEACGDSGLLVNPLDSDAMADSIQKIVENSSLAAELRGKGYLRAEQFEWKKNAKELLDKFRIIHDS